MTPAVLVEQLALDLGAACVDGLSLLDGLLPVQPGPLGRRKCDQHGGGDDAAQSAAAACGRQPAVAKMAEGLHQQEQHGGCRRRGIVRVIYDLQERPEEHGAQAGEGKKHPAILGRRP